MEEGWSSVQKMREPCCEFVNKAGGENREKRVNRKEQWGGAQTVNWWIRQQGLTFESDDDWFNNDDSQTIMRQNEEIILPFFLSLSFKSWGRLSAIGILWSAGQAPKLLGGSRKS